MQRYFGTIEDAQHVWLQLVQSSQLPIEHDVAGLFGEDPVEAGAHHAGAPGIRIALVSLEVSIIPPDQTSLQIQRATVRIAERLQLVDKPLGVDPALRMIANSELARTIGNDHRVPEQTLVTYGTPERCFGGYLDRIGLDCKCVEAKCLEVPSPGVFISEALLWMISQRSNRCRRHVHGTHPGQCCVIDDKVRTSGLQQRQENAAGLGHCRAEHGEAVVAQLGHKTIPARMACRRVINADPAGCLKPCTKNGLILGCQRFQPLAQETNHLALRNLEPHAVQKRRQPFTRHLPLEMAGSNKAADLGAKTTDDARWQRRHDPLARRRLPALATIAGYRHADLQVLDQHIFIPAKTRSWRYRRLQPDLAGHRQFVAQRAAAAPAALLACSLRCGLLHAGWLRLELWSGWKSLQTRDLILQRRNLGILQSHHCCMLIGSILKRRHLRRKRADNPLQVCERCDIVRI